MENLKLSRNLYCAMMNSIVFKYENEKKKYENNQQCIINKDYENIPSNMYDYYKDKTEEEKQDLRKKLISGNLESYESESRRILKNMEDLIIRANTLRQSIHQMSGYIEWEKIDY